MVWGRRAKKDVSGLRVQSSMWTHRRAHAIEERVCDLLALGGVSREDVAGGSPAPEHGDKLGLARRRAAHCREVNESHSGALARTFCWSDLDLGNVDHRGIKERKCEFPSICGTCRVLDR